MMKRDILFDLVVDKEKKTIKVKRSFHAALPLVWQAWTTAEILDQWWAPQPWKAETQSMDFREGGRWFYAMVSPDGKERHWCIKGTLVKELQLKQPVGIPAGQAWYEERRCD